MAQEESGAALSRELVGQKIVSVWFLTNEVRLVTEECVVSIDIQIDGTYRLVRQEG